LQFQPSWELSFIIGSFLGDGSFVEDSDYHHHVKLAVRDRDFAEAFNLAVGHILDRKTNKLLITHDLGKVYYESKYSCQSLGLFLKLPLEQLRPFMNEFPGEFLSGLFSADGSASVSLRSFGLLTSIILTNSRVELLSMVDELLRTYFDIHSRTYLNKRRGTTWKNGKKTVVLRKDSYNLCIIRRQDIKTFLSRIGFMIKRKQDRAEKAIHLIETLGRSKAAEVWRLTSNASSMAIA
jgi:intein-encoded DNA endonuclease-like protein